MTGYVDVMLNHRQCGVTQILFEQEHVAPIQKELGCVGVPHEVWMEPGDSRGLGEPLCEGPEGVRRQRVSIYGEEKGILPWTGRFNPEEIRVVNESPLTGYAESDDALLVAFAQYLDVPVLEMNVLLLQTGDFRQATSEILSPVSNIRE